MKKVFTILIVLIISIFPNQAQTVSDKDGNIYDTVHIGTQVWMKQNLATTKYNDGSNIPKVTDQNDWAALQTPAYCWYANDSVTNKPYGAGALYNWFTVNTGKLCPSGWHVPSNTEWHTLVLFLDPSAQDCYCTESSIAADKLKEAGLTHWGKGNNGNNSSGFTALSTGYRNYKFKSDQGHPAVAYFWSSTSQLPTIWHRYIQNASALVFEYLDYPQEGMAVRCIMDNAAKVNELNFDKKIQIFPNPAIDRITIENIEYQNLNFSIYNLIGKLVLQRQLTNNKNEVDVSNLSKGIYIIKISGAEATMQQKLIKE